MVLAVGFYPKTGVGDCGGGGEVRSLLPKAIAPLPQRKGTIVPELGAIASPPFPLTHLVKYLFLFWWRGGEAIRCSPSNCVENLEL